MRLVLRSGLMLAAVAVLFAVPSTASAKSVAPFPCKKFGAKLDRYQQKLERKIERFRKKAENADTEEERDSYRLFMQEPRGALVAASRSERRIDKENCRRFRYKAVIRWLNGRAYRAFKAKARANRVVNSTKSKEKAKRALMRLDFFGGQQGGFGRVRTWVRQEAKRRGVSV